LKFREKIGQWIVRSLNLQKYSPFLAELFGAGRPSATGVTVSAHTAMTSTAVWAAVKLIAGIMAMLPLPVYKKLKPRGKVRSPDHAMAPVLNQISNPEMTAFQYRETMMVHLLLWGNHYAAIERNGAGAVTALWPLNPWATYPQRDINSGKLWYITVLPNGEQRKLPFDQVLHIAGISELGILGLNPTNMNKEAIGIGIALERFCGKFFGNGAKIGGVLEHPGKLSDLAHKRLRESLEDIHVGLENAHKLAILEEGMKFNETMANPEQSQMLGARTFQINEVARMFNLPPHVLGELTRSTNNNIEQQSLELVMYCLGPWCARIEQAINMRCLTGYERELGYFTEHLIQGILRGDIKSRYEAYKTAIQNCIMSPNEARECENMNPIDGGDTYFAPLNTIPLDMIHGYFENKKVGDIKNEPAKNGD
jgi:HK97 family phage portal protein